MKHSTATLEKLIGQRFGRLTVLALVPRQKGVHISYVCLCDCGTEKRVLRGSLMSGRTESCGCLATEIVIARSTKHGMARRGRQAREFRIWQAMKTRCLNPNQEEYHRYGGRGIRVCERWLESFLNFFEDMGPCPKNFSLERKDADGDYTPENCVWADRETQGNNTSTNVYVEYDGQRTSLIQLARKLGLNYNRLHWHFRRRGLPLAEAIAKVRGN